MEWLVFALIGQFLIAFAIIFAKILRTKVIKDTLVYLTYVGIISFIAVLVLIPIVGFDMPSKTILLYAFFTSLPFTLGAYFIIKAFSTEDVSRISILLQLQPVLVLILATIFLNEILTVKQYSGFFIIFLGSLIVSYKFNSLKKISRVFWILMATNIFWGIYITMAKFTYSIYGFWNTFILVRVFFMLYSLLIFIYLISKQRFDIKKILTKGTALVGLNELLVVVAVGFSQYALSIGKASLVTVVKGTSSIFVLFLAYFFSVKFPKLLKEEMNKKIISQKVIAIFLIIIGLVLITL